MDDKQRMRGLIDKLNEASRRMNPIFPMTNGMRCTQSCVHWKKERASVWKIHLRGAWAAQSWRALSSIAILPDCGAWTKRRVKMKSLRGRSDAESRPTKPADCRKSDSSAGDDHPHHTADHSVSGTHGGAGRGHHAPFPAEKIQ